MAHFVVTTKNVSPQNAAPTVSLDSLIAAARYRSATDEDFAMQRTCWHCRYYSVKSYTNDDINRGKCFGIAEGRVAYANGSDLCDNFQPD